MNKIALLLLALAALLVMVFFARSCGKDESTNQSGSTPDSGSEVAPTSGSGISQSSSGGSSTNPKAATSRPVGQSTPDTGPAPPTDAEGYQILADDLLEGFGSDEQTPERDLQQLEGLLGSYTMLVKQNRPSWGENRELVSILLGKNPNRLRLVRPGTPAINADGELLDRWGTPIFFHAISEDVIDIHMAGPDRAMHTDDDLVIKNSE